MHRATPSGSRATEPATAAVFEEVLVPVAFSSPEHDEADGGRVVDVEGAAVHISAASEAALALASRLVGRGRVRLVHATPELRHLSIYGGAPGAWFPLDGGRGLQEAARVRSLAVLRHFASVHCPDARIAYAIAAGKPSQLILTVAAAHPPGAIVLATSGHSSLRRMLGSTAGRIIRQADCPVIVVPAPLGAE